MKFEPTSQLCHLITKSKFYFNIIVFSQFYRTQKNASFSAQKVNKVAQKASEGGNNDFGNSQMTSVLTFGGVQIIKMEI